eukprot:g7166.t1
MFSAAGTSKGPPSACASSATPYGVAPFGKGGFVSTSGFVAGKYTGGGPFQKGKFTTKHGAHLLSSVGVGKQVLNPAAGPLGGGPGTNYHMGAVKGAAPPYGAAGFVPAGSTATTSNPYAGYGNGQQLQVQYPQQHQGGGQGKPKGQAPGYGQLIIHSGGGKGGVGAGASQQIHNGGGAAPAAASSSAGPTPTTAALPNNDTTLTRTSGVTSPGGQNGSETGRSPAADANANANASQNNNHQTTTPTGTPKGFLTGRGYQAFNPQPVGALHPIQMNGHPMQMKGVGVGVGIPMAGGGMIPPGAIPIGAPPGMLAAGGKGGTTFVPIRPPGPGGGMVPPGGVGGMIGAAFRRGKIRFQTRRGQWFIKSWSYLGGLRRGR